MFTCIPQADVHHEDFASLLTGLRAVYNTRNGEQRGNGELPTLAIWKTYILGNAKCNNINT